jgi:hypothetical protein
MKPIIGVYLGWIPPHSKLWEPLYRTIRCERGYHSERTRLYAPTIERYPGLKEPLDFRADPLDLPYALRKRTPLVRPDYEWCAKFLNLPYPNLDIFEYIGRSGGLMSGDPFSIFPIVEPNDDGNYTYETLLGELDPKVRDELSERSQMNTIASSRNVGSTELEESIVVTVHNRVLGKLLPPFARLGDKISKIQITKISEQHYFLGRQILMSLETTVNLSESSIFELETAGAVSV